MMESVGFYKSCVTCCVVICVLFTTPSVAAKNGYGTRTPYSLFHPAATIADNELYMSASSCSAIHVTFVGRHGARNPSATDITHISDIHTRIKGILDRSKFQALVDWKNPFLVEEAIQMNNGGIQEQTTLGARISRRLRSLFLQKELSTVKFVVSSARRTNESNVAFYEGMKQSLNIQDVGNKNYNSEVHDELLRFTDTCEKYRVSVNTNTTANMELDKWKTGTTVAQLLLKVNQNLGLQDGVLKPADLFTMFEICGIQKSQAKSSPWCGVFDDVDLAVLDYWIDLDKYYKWGPPYKISSQQSCPLVSNVFKGMDTVIGGDRSSVATIMDGHGVTLGPFYTALGLFKNTPPLTSKNFDVQTNRPYKMAEILPFSANIMFVLYNCTAGDSQYKLQVLVNEKPVTLPGCPDVLCPYNTLRQKYSSMIDECEFEKLCKPDSETSGSNRSFPLGILIITMFIAYMC